LDLLFFKNHSPSNIPAIRKMKPSTIAARLPLESPPLVLLAIGAEVPVVGTVNKGEVEVEVEVGVRLRIGVEDGASKVKDSKVGI
jgi:hypothetical protein